MFDKLKKKFSEIFSKQNDNNSVVENDVSSEKQVNEENTGKEGNQRVIKRSEIDNQIMEILLESDVSLDSADLITEKLKERMGKLKRRVDFYSVEDELKNVIKEIISENQNRFDILNPGKKPYIILFLGINGTGKTTTIAKLAYYLKNNGKKVVISASDTFRAGAIEQISILGKNIGVEVIKHDFKSDPASVAFDAIEHARARPLDYVLIDSAGRMQTNKNLLDEMKKIKRVSKPDLTLLVLDAMIGQDVIEQANTFAREINFDGIILTKLDTDAKGGAVISVSTEIKKPILFVGTGQNMDDIMPFDPDWYINKIFSS
ncbi:MULTISPECIES: signal recognition particle-docking protein FtsY [unclassified Acidiplasma]|uniref:signal recognition particle-docking protein FtsY n=1 Tax=unclassified Acidiplasma TaxID=2641301 RepID=UPI0005E918C4|nr:MULTISPECIES: signal recognition particle-docking protein FtsY [unclassified Acidiplasma]KJE49919.1 cell division protein FtsY [Acidiplasma sp. MBA-1]WMT55105.1 MAG: signal recognition particle-docking protein FtsY [Acidiplasma sp.]